MSALTLPSRGEAANGALRYERHRPEQTTLYRLVQQHAASFIAHTEASTGSELSRMSSTPSSSAASWPMAS